MDLVDIHTHILYGMDDGARTPDESVAMLEAAYDQGVRTVFLTPHSDRCGFNFERASEHISALAPIIKQRFKGLRIYGGCEIMYSHSAAEGLVTKQLPTLAGSRYVLVEFMPGAFCTEIVSGVRKLVSHGYIPIIAHAERCVNLKKNNIEELIDYGALIQLNAASVLGKRGLSAKRFCKALLKDGLVHFIASDTHDMKNRSSLLGSCAQYVSKKYGEQYANELFYKNAQAIID